MGSKKNREARDRLTPGGEFRDISDRFPGPCKGDRPCRNIVAIGAGIILAHKKAERGVISSPEYAEANGLAELSVLADLAKWSGCPGPGENHVCPAAEYMGQVVSVANFGSEVTIEKGTFKRGQNPNGLSSPGTYL